MLTGLIIAVIAGFFWLIDYERKRDKRYLEQAKRIDKLLSSLNDGRPGRPITSSEQPR
jgi:hypothetical protein